MKQSNQMNYGRIFDDWKFLLIKVFDQCLHIEAARDVMDNIAKEWKGK